MTKEHRTALVCPLDWGLGHAARLIPVVRELDRYGYHIVLGGSGRSFALLQNEFPSLPHLALSSFTVRYAAGRSQVIRLLLQIPLMLHNLCKEHRQLVRLVAEHAFDLVISDNRYGLYCKTTCTVLITHQLSPLLPGGLKWLEYPLHKMIGLLVGRFDACWIPDLPAYPSSLSGSLSHRNKLPDHARFIGILSRFSCWSSDFSRERNSVAGREKGPGFSRKESPLYPGIFEIVVVLSGPEPQRTILFDMLLPQARATGLRTLFVCGLMEADTLTEAQNGPVTCLPHLPTDVLFHILVHSRVIICRSGYSSLMDLVAIGRTAILIPTPGQTEQEYLAQHASARYRFIRFDQKDFSLEKALKAFRAGSTRSVPSFHSGGEGLLSAAIRDLQEKDKHDGYEAQEKS